MQYNLLESVGLRHQISEPLHNYKLVSYLEVSEIAYVIGTQSGGLKPNRRSI